MSGWQHKCRQLQTEGWRKKGEGDRGTLWTSKLHLHCTAIQRMQWLALCSVSNSLEKELHRRYSSKGDQNQTKPVPLTWFKKTNARPKSTSINLKQCSCGFSCEVQKVKKQKSLKLYVEVHFLHFLLLLLQGCLGLSLNQYQVSAFILLLLSNGWNKHLSKM